MKTLTFKTITVIALLLTLISTGCKSTFKARSVKPSGFLTNTAQLKKGGKDQALLVYIDDKADFKKYTKIMMDPVKGYGSDNRDSIKKLKKEDQQKLLNYFDAALRKEIGKSYQFVKEPGPDVLKLRVAITDADGANVVLDTVSSVIPIGIALSSIKAIATGTHLSVGEIGAEFEALDSVSGTRLAAAIDSRAGRKYTLKFDKFKKWRTAEDAFDYWADITHQRLNELSGRAAEKK